MKLQSIEQYQLKDQKVLLRLDLNVPIKTGSIIDDSRIVAILPTIKYLIKQQAKITIITHLGRPQGKFIQALSLKPIAEYLERALKLAIVLAPTPQAIKYSHKITLLENIRFFQGEETNDEKLALKLVKDCDYFVMEAFASAHRQHASVSGCAKLAPISLAGPLVIQELEQISKAMHNPNTPTLAIIGGAKISTKLPIIAKLLSQFDQTIIGGGMANTFLAAKGYQVGKSLMEHKWIAAAKQLIQEHPDKIVLPLDHALENNQYASIEAIHENDIIGDVGPKTIQHYVQIIKSAKSIIWNGPIGIFEQEAFSLGTKAIAKAIAAQNNYSIIGGGDTIAAINKFQCKNFSYISTGGGAFLALLENKPLPGLIHLKQN